MKWILITFKKNTTNFKKNDISIYMYKSWYNISTAIYLLLQVTIQCKQNNYLHVLYALGETLSLTTTRMGSYLTWTLTFFFSAQKYGSKFSWTHFKEFGVVKQVAHYIESYLTYMTQRHKIAILTIFCEWCVSIDWIEYYHRWVSGV